MGLRNKGGIILKVENFEIDKNMNIEKFEENIKIFVNEEMDMEILEVDKNSIKFKPRGFISTYDKTLLNGIKNGAFQWEVKDDCYLLTYSFKSISSLIYITPFLVFWLIMITLLSKYASLLFMSGVTLVFLFMCGLFVVQKEIAKKNFYEYLKKSLEEDLTS